LLLALNLQLHGIARVLLEHGAEPNAKDNAGQIPLHALLYYADLDEDKRYDSVQLLLEHGANVNAQDKDHTTPLLLALKWWLYGIARVLLEHGADPNAKDNAGNTPLHALLYCVDHDEDEDGRFDSVQLLLEHGANVNSQDKDHTTPLHLAMKWTLPRIARVLLDHGAEPKVENNHGKTPLHLVFEHGLKNNHSTLRLNEEILKASATRLLLERGADVNAQDKDHTTSLLLAIQRNLYDIVRILLTRGAEPNVKNQNGQTPSHLLLEGDFANEDDIPGLVHLLLDRGADVNALDQNYATPLWLAAEQVMVVNPQIFNHSVRPSIKNEGKTPLYLMSNHPRRLEIAQIILDHAAADKDRVLLHMSLEGE
jgi:ankyrin repeat protein